MSIYSENKNNFFIYCIIDRTNHRLEMIFCFWCLVEIFHPFHLHYRDFMDPTMDNTKHILNYLMPIIERVNPEVYDFMQQWVDLVFMFVCMLKHNGLIFFFFTKSSFCNFNSISWKNDDQCSLLACTVWDKCLYFVCRAEVGTIFALSWLITWFGHVLSDFRHVVRLYDFFLACHPLMPIYFAAVVRFRLSPSNHLLKLWVSGFWCSAEVGQLF